MLVSVGAQVAQGVRTENPTADGYVRAIGLLMQHASKWAAVSASGIKCATRHQNPIGEVRLCAVSAIGACVACGQATCFSHAMISPADGQIVCYGCVGVAQKFAQKLGSEWYAKKEPAKQVENDRGSDPSVCRCRFPWERAVDCPVHGDKSHGDKSDSLRRDHLKTLGLGAEANWDEVRIAFKKLALKHHPDRASTARRRSGAEARFKKITAAFEWLKADKEKKAA